jgi:hypothetical protein
MALFYPNLSQMGCIKKEPKLRIEYQGRLLKEGEL